MMILDLFSFIGKGILLAGAVALAVICTVLGLMEGRREK